MRLLIVVLFSLLVSSCAALDAVTLGSSLLTPAKDGIEANATIQLAQDAESNKNKLATSVQTARTNNVQADAVTYNNSGLPWYGYVMIFMAWLIKEPIEAFFTKKKE